MMRTGDGHPGIGRVEGGARRAPARRRARGRRGFTLVELLVVITVIAIGASLLVPAFGELLRSVNYSNAVNTVSGALGSARALAIRDQRHTAVAFLFDVEREVASVQVLQLQGQAAGSLSTLPGASQGETRDAFIYRPATGQVPIDLPKGTAVFAVSFQTAPQNAEIDQSTSSWYAGWREQTGALRPLWLFPMNDGAMFTEHAPPQVRFRGVDPWDVLRGTAPSGANVSPADARNAVRHAQTFVVQFAPDGSVVTTPRSGETFVPNAYVEYPNAPVDRSQPSEDPYDWPDIFDPENEGQFAPDPPGTPQQKDLSPNPEVFVRSADQLAVVDLNELARQTGIQRPWFVRPEGTGFPEPQWLRDLGYFEQDVDTPDVDQMPRHRLISRWIDRNGEILSFDRYSGKVIRRESP